MLALDIIQSGSNPILKTISDLVHGSYGWLQSLAFILVAFWFFVFVSRLYSVTKRKISSLTGASFLSITSIGFFLIAIFPAQTTGLEQTLQGLIHDSVAGLISSSYWIYTIITVMFCLAFALLWALIPLEWQLRGLGERLLLTSGFAWVVVISLRLVRLCREPQEVTISKFNTEQD
jgi:hypothetical protein